MRSRIDRIISEIGQHSAAHQALREHEQQSSIKSKVLMHLCRFNGLDELWLKSPAMSLALHSTVDDTKLSDFADASPEVMIASIAATTDARFEILLHLLAQYPEDVVMRAAEQLGLRNGTELEACIAAEQAQRELALHC